jgi:hypothetical protein
MSNVKCLDLPNVILLRSTWPFVQTINIIRHGVSHVLRHVWIIYILCPEFNGKIAHHFFRPNFPNFPQLKKQLTEISIQSILGAFFHKVAKQGGFLKYLFISESKDFI